ncbi:S-layer homology domain-containing protein [Priestia koreensis]|uniref:S-layer homology domain-containing protein n=1 Tax=Priestia koreensis TaxID=284581 RepID=UPI0030175057
MKKLVSSLLIGAILVGGTPLMTAQAADDGITGIALENEVRDLIARGILQGTNGDYKLNAIVTRGEFAAFISRALKLPDGTGNFADVPASVALAKGIYSAYSAGLVSGYKDGLFHPSEPITREQAAAIIKKALDYKQVTAPSTPASFSDLTTASPSFQASILQVAGYGIIKGNANPDGTYAFSPTKQATRAEAAAFISRMLKLVEAQEVPKLSSLGLAYAKPTTADHVLKIYPTSVLSGDYITYVSADTEMRYLSSGAGYVQVAINDVVGYVSATQVQIVDQKDAIAKSYYQASGGKLVHRLYNVTSDTYVGYEYGPAPEQLESGKKYYSPNGYSFYDEAGTFIGNFYQYFNYLPIRSKTNYTAEELNNYVQKNFPAKSGVNTIGTLGEYFKKAEAAYNVNALYLMAHALTESTNLTRPNGVSQIADEKKNIYGINATDRDPSGDAKAFKTYEDCINTYAREYMNNRYADPANKYFNGSVSGNKSVGFNVMYASDPFWGQKVSGHMYRADRFLGGKDYGVYNIGLTVKSGVYVREGATVDSNFLYKYPDLGTPFIILGNSSQPDGYSWYNIVSDDIRYNSAYTRADNIQEMTYVPKNY